MSANSVTSRQFETSQRWGARGRTLNLRIKSLSRVDPASRFRPRPPDPDEALSLWTPADLEPSLPRHLQPMTQLPLESLLAGRMRLR